MSAFMGVTHTSIAPGVAAIPIGQVLAPGDEIAPAPAA